MYLMQQHFDGTDYSQVAKSLSKMRREEEGWQQQKCGTGFEKVSSSQTGLSTGILKKTVSRILQGDLKKRKSCPRPVPPTLTTEQW